jgi:hypothetical protein
MKINMQFKKMKQLSIILSISLLLWSCSKNQPKKEIINTNKAKINIVETKIKTAKLTKEAKPKKVDSVSKQIITNSPCIELQKFVVDIEKMNWVSDTTRLNKVSIYKELNREKIKYFNERPFYTISFENSRLNKAYNSGMFKSNFNPFDFKLFKGVKNIWGYFYRDKKGSNWISDGVIEQWEFETQNQANKAFKKMLKVGDFIYFNTNPYFCRVRNKLIIFQARAMAFSHDQKPLFEKFVKEKVPDMGCE